LIYSKKSLDSILLILSAGLVIDGTLYTFFLGHEDTKIKIGTSFFSLEIPQFYTGALIATFVILAMYYGNIKAKMNERDLEMIINRTVYETLGLSKAKESEPKTDNELIMQASDAYESDNFEDCISTLDKIKTNDEVILEKKAYFRILALYKSYENQLLNFIPLKEENINNLEDLFNLYLSKYKESSKFTVVLYFYGHFQRTFRLNKEKAMAIFDDIVNNYSYSKWMQGALYYSALLHYDIGTENDKQLAIERLKFLSKQDGELKIFESGMTVDAAEVAKRTLINWGAVPLAESPKKS
jgi:hypothetical protein